MGFQQVRAPEKSVEAKVRVRVRARTVMDLNCSHVPTGLPCCEVNETSEDQDEGKDLALRRRCFLHRGDTTFRLDFFINRMNLMIN